MNMLVFAAVALFTSFPCLGQVVTSPVVDPPTFEGTGTLLLLSSGDPDVQPGNFAQFHMDGGAIDDCSGESEYSCPLLECADGAGCDDAQVNGCYRVVFGLRLETEVLDATPVIIKLYRLSTTPCPAL